jgi:hypothetical protein
MGYTVELKRSIFNDDQGTCISVGPDADGLGGLVRVYTEEKHSQRSGEDSMTSEDDLESYTHQSADDGSEIDDDLYDLYCEGCDRLIYAVFETDDRVELCRPCYDLRVEESEDKCEN